MLATRRTNLRFGAAMLAFGLAFLLVGYLWHSPRLRQTTGVITQSEIAPQMGNAASRRIDYQYTVDAAQYSGQAFLRYDPRWEGVFAAGRSITVYYDASNPSQSYAARKPSNWPVFVFGFVFTVFGGIILVLACRQ